MQRTFWFFYGLAALFLLPPGILLFLFAATGTGHLCGLILLLLLWLPLSVVILLKAQRRRGLCAALTLVSVVLPLLLLVWLAAVSPDGRSQAGSGVSSIYSGASKYARFSAFNLLPEADQMKVGVMLATVFDARLEVSRARRLLNLALPLYREMDARPEYVALGSVRNYACAELFGGACDSGHFYQYVPAHAPGERLPVIVFLHGAAGNFKIYLYLWQRYADAHRCIVVLPSFGFGNWANPGSVWAIERVRQHCIDQLNADSERIFLVGLSNGGTGVSRAGLEFPQHYRGLVFISGVMESGVLGRSEFHQHWKGRPVLIIHGQEDERIPQNYAAHAVNTLRSGGVEVSYRPYSAEDHFLWFSCPETVFSDISQWVRQIDASRGE